MKKLTFFLLAFVSYQVYAYTGDELLIDCKWYIDVMENNGTTKNISKSLSSGRCQGFISATVNSYNHYIVNKQIQENLFCLPADINTTGLAKTITQYLQQNESKINEPATGLAIQALMEAYPCE